jgi:hypothetical protein
MYMRLEIAAVSRSRHALRTWGTKLAVERIPAIVARTVGIHELISPFPSLDGRQRVETWGVPTSRRGG